MNRRRFLLVGATGAAALAAAGLWTWLARPRASEVEAETDAILVAIVPALLDGALPPDGLARTAAIRETVDRVHRAIAGLAPHARAELGQLFALLALPVGRRVFAGVAEPWREAPGADVAQFLSSWQASGWSLKRTAYDALHQLVFAAWYADPRSWDAIRYPGPPKLG